jgi:phosphoglycolate phosphatase-like HAD superfamily hydrolase
MQAAIFDLDQTLVDSSALLNLRQARQWQQVMKELDKIVVYDHITAYIATLQQLGIPFGIVTNSPKMYCEALMQRFDWHPQAIVAWHCTRQHKPHPAPVLKALSDMGVTASPSVFGFGDDANDVLAYAAAAIRPVGCIWGAMHPQQLLAAVDQHQGLVAHTLSAAKLLPLSKPAL